MNFIHMLFCAWASVSMQLHAHAALAPSLYALHLVHSMTADHRLTCSS